jgi:TRAP-type mannitol/chloroaromatic compound transport system substrate-binding protein
MGFGEVTKYWAVPGWHQPASVMGVMINKKAWDSLDKELQQTIQYAAKVATLEFFCKQYFDGIEYTQKFIDKGIEINSYPQEDLDRIQALVDGHTAELAKNDPLFKKSMESQIKFRKAFAQWREMEGPFGFGYNPKTYPNLE